MGGGGGVEESENVFKFGGWGWDGGNLKTSHRWHNVTKHYDDTL